jgi:hypothetical protein
VQAALPAWASAGASSRELSWLKEGFTLPFMGDPPAPFHKGVSCRNAMPDQRAFLLKELQRGLDTGAFEQGQRTRFVSKAFLIPKIREGQAPTWRLVFDLRHINSFLQARPCRFETLKRLSSMAREGDYMISLDLADGFHAVPVHPEHRQYLTFEVEGFGLFQCAALPFGLSSSPFVFTKVMRTFVRAMRAPLAPLADGTPRARPSGTDRTIFDLLPRFGNLMRTGLRVLPYMDDFLLLCRSYKEALEARSYVEALLDLLGLARNPKKGVWEPTQVLEHLGLGVDTARGLFFVTPKRLAKLTAASTDLLKWAARNRGLVPRRRLAGFVGLAQSLYLAVPPARFFLRELHDALGKGDDWFCNVRLCRLAKASLQWFCDLPQRWNGRAIWRSPHTAVLHCDASMEAWGGAMNGLALARGFWRPHQRRQHITVLELRAVYLTILSFVRQLRGRRVLLWEDNQAVVAILMSWTTKSPELMRELRKLWFLLDTNDMTLDPRYIRSAQNIIADGLTRQGDSGDWRLNPAIFARLQALWGPFTIDRFATANNTQLPRFNSAYHDPQTEGVDAFAQSNWVTEANYCNPPWDLLGQLAHLLVETGAPATVVVPFWPAQPWYQQLQELAVDSIHLPAQPDLFSPGLLGTGVSVGPPRWPVACFRIPARPPAGGAWRRSAERLACARPPPAPWISLRARR